jgi:hypothetical protein
VHQHAQATICELDPDEPDDEQQHALFPIAWFQFADAAAREAAAAAHPGWEETGEFIYELRQKRCTGLLLALLVSSEDRMREMHDDHTVPNIDCELVAARGHTLVVL